MFVFVLVYSLWFYFCFFFCVFLGFFYFFFFFQAEDGIRDHCVTGVQTCALPISSASRWRTPRRPLSAAGSRSSPARCQTTRGSSRFPRANRSVSKRPTG